MLNLLAFCLLDISQVDSATSRPIRQLAHTRWTARDGAPTEIRALAQSANGYLWLGTRSGLVRFDGARFVRFSPRAGDTIPSGGVHRLTAARDGSLWIVFRSGAVSRLSSAGRLTSYGPRDGLPPAFQVAESSTGALVAGTTEGLSRFTRGRWEDAPVDWRFPGARAPAIWFDRTDALWVETQDRIVYRPASGGQFLDPGMRLAGPSSRGDFAEAQDGRIWFSGAQQSVHTVPRAGEQRPVARVLVASVTLLIDRKGCLWVGTIGNGLRRVPNPSGIQGHDARLGDGAEQFTERDGLLSNVVFALVEDREGSVWVASDRGLERFRESIFTPIPTSGPIRARYVFGTRDSAVWSASYNVPEIVRYHPRGQDTIPADFLSTNIIEDPSGIVWMVSGNRIVQYRGRRLADVQRSWKNNRTFTGLTVDRAGGVWLFDQGFGLLRLARDSLFPVVQFPASPFPNSHLLSDRQGRVWVGQRGRVGLYERGRLRLFGAAEGVRSEVNAVFEDHNGNVWIGTDDGLSRFSAGRFRTLPEHQSPPGRAVYGIVADDQRAWWMVTPAGVHRLAPGEADRALMDSGYVLSYRSFDFLDGLPGMVSSNSAYGPQITRSSDGRIWVATDSGVATVDPRDLPRAPPPQVLIEGLRVGGRALDTLAAVELPPGVEDLEVDYTATLLSLPERLRFRYRLEGVDHAWRDVGTRRQAHYTGLAPGTYRFRVTARNGDGAWNATEALLDFRVRPAWYQTSWFKAAAALLAGALIAGVALLVQRRRSLRSEEALKARYEAMLTERARIAQDLHDTLLQGFAGVTLQLKAAELALPEQPDVAAETIFRVQQLARISLKEARDRVWDMHGTEQADDDLPAALERIARERTVGTGIDVSLRTLGERRRLSHEVEDGALRIGREAIVNVVRHAEAGRIEIEVEFETRLLRLEVRDDGRGLPPEEAEQARHRGHFGLSGARERATLMGGRCNVIARPGGGTIVALQLPIPPDGRS
jgi:signal transduction histidine kinase/ligand-binding sensor domain-containing protein